MTRFFISFCILFLLAGAKPSENLRKNQKSVKVSSHGSGQSLEEARNNALINALQIVSGSYVSSSIAVENDVIIKNNINVFTSGSIKSAKILTKEVIDKRHYVLMSVVVNPLNLIEKVNNKSSNKIKINSSVFLDNLQLFKIQSLAEEKAIYEISKAYNEFIQKRLSYVIIKYDQMAYKDAGACFDGKCIKVVLAIKVKNKEKVLAQAKRYAFKNLSILSVNPSEIESLKKLTSLNYMPSYWLKPTGPSRKSVQKYHVRSCEFCKRIDRSYHRTSCALYSNKTKKMKVDDTRLFFRNNLAFNKLFSDEVGYKFSLKLGDKLVLNEINGTFKDNDFKGAYKSIYFQYVTAPYEFRKDNIIYLESIMFKDFFEKQYAPIRNIEVVNN